MVNLKTVEEENFRFASAQHAELVLVFAGATAGIGLSTLERMLTMVQRSTFYVIGRSATKFAAKLEMLKALNRGSTIIFLEAQFSLISDIDDVSKKISAAENKVDYLFLSPGAVPLNGATCTSSIN